jgi:hypothetical protein
MISSRFPEARIFTFARAMREDIDQALESGAKAS